MKKRVCSLVIVIFLVSFSSILTRGQVQSPYQKVNYADLPFQFNARLQSLEVNSDNEIISVKGVITEFSLGGRVIELMVDTIAMIKKEAFIITKKYGNVKLSMNSNAQASFWLTQSQIEFFKKLLRSENKLVITKGPILKDLEGNNYKTISINSQVWMAENLKSTKFNDGTDIQLVTESKDWDNLTTAGFCWYDNNITYKPIYGALYNWYVVGSKKLCPLGWHVPSADEWSILISNLGGEAGFAGGKLKEIGTTHWKTPNSGATNESGFTALPGGSRYSWSFSEIYTYGSWWSSTDYENPSGAYGFGVNYNSGKDAHSYPTLKKCGQSVRCKKD